MNQILRLLFIDYPAPLAESIKWEIIEKHAQKLLRQCDWTQLPDSSLSFLKKLEWQGYRDALQSIRDAFTNPDDVVFPTEPTEE